MAKLSISRDQFLGVYELNKMREFLDEQGFRKHIIDSMVNPGIINNSKNGLFNNALVQKGSSDNTLKINEIRAIDSDGNFIYGEAKSSLALPSGSGWYWIKISHQYSRAERGTISISTNGTLSGNGTNFLTSLRGYTTDRPSKIKFIGAVDNTQEYEISQVIDDENAILNVAQATAENNLQYRLIGTFTPSKVPTEEEKKIFNYDSCSLELIAETTVNQAPELIAGKEFYIARVRSIDADVQVQDKRRNYLYAGIAQYSISNIDRSVNPLIGVENVRYNGINTTRDNAVMEIAWGMRVSDWTFDSSVNRITVVSGQGGKYKTTNDFDDGDFDGWRLYFSNGKYSIIKQSTRTASQISLILDTIDPNDLSDENQVLFIAPDANSITIYATPLERLTSTTSGVTITQTFNIGVNLARVQLPVLGTLTSAYNIQYKLSNSKEHSPKRIIPDDESVGFYDPESFNSDGTFKDIVDRIRRPYTQGDIVFTTSVLSYINKIQAIETGDLFGFERRQLTNSNTLIDVQVGKNFQVQEFYTEGLTALTNIIKINLKTENAVSGNKFILRFDTFAVILQSIDITQDEDTQLFQITPQMASALNQDRIMLRCEYDGSSSSWKVFTHISQDLSVDVSTKLTALQTGSINVSGGNAGPYFRDITHNLGTNSYNVQITIEWVDSSEGNDNISVLAISNKEPNSCRIRFIATTSEPFNIKLNYLIYPI